MNAITPTATATATPISDDEFDARMAFLSIADAHYHLVESGAETLDYGFDRVAEMFDIMFPLEEPIPAPIAPPRKVPKPHPTPQTTIEAVMHSVRESGVGALKEPATAARLAACDQAARAEINRRIERLRRHGVIQ